MKKIAHISDLHFGRVPDQADDILLEDLKSIDPSFIAISGDLTQRALRSEFKTARRFLSRLPAPHLVVPGNHDVPFFDVTRRFLLPLHRYKYYISKHTSPVHIDEHFTMLGVNTARSFVLSGGRIARKQMKKMERTIGGLHSENLRIVVTHHPFTVPKPAHKRKRIVGGAKHALKTFEKCGIDLVLSGHYHRRHASDLKASFPQMNRSMLHVQAGTAISSRLRKEPNSYNVITIDGNTVIVEVRERRGDRYISAQTSRFTRNNGEWISESVMTTLSAQEIPSVQVQGQLIR